MNKEIIICVRISGSGKSSWVYNFLKDNRNYLRINRDDIRTALVSSLDGYYQRNDLNSIEEIVTRLEDNVFDNAWGKNKYLVIDNTNLKQKYINRWLTKINEYNSKRASGAYPDSPVLDFRFRLFDCDLNEAKRRVFTRDFDILAPAGSTCIDDVDYLSLDSLKYLDKQFEDYIAVREWIKGTYESKIIL